MKLSSPCEILTSNQEGACNSIDCVPQLMGIAGKATLLSVLLPRLRLSFDSRAGRSWPHFAPDLREGSQG
ncbi:unnamed protein product [Prunus armeniaca]